MKKTIITILAMMVLALGFDGARSVTFPKNPFKTEEASAEIKWVSSSRCSGGGYYRDTSNDGNPYNNANYLGYND